MLTHFFNRRATFALDENLGRHCCFNNSSCFESFAIIFHCFSKCNFTKLEIFAYFNYPIVQHSLFNNSYSSMVVLWEALYFCMAKIGKSTSFPQLYAKVERPPLYYTIETCDNLIFMWGHRRFFFSANISPVIKLISRDWLNIWIEWLKRECCTIG